MVFFPEKRRKHRLQTAVLDSFLDAVVVIDIRNRVVFFNDAAESLWGYAREEVIGRDVSMLVPAGLREHHHRFITANRRGERCKGVGTSREAQLERKDGMAIWVNISLSQAWLEDGLGYTALVRDITAERNLRSLLDGRQHMQAREV